MDTNTIVGIVIGALIGRVVRFFYDAVRNRQSIPPLNVHSKERRYMMIRRDQ
jgi:hypothetical protein